MKLPKTDEKSAENLLVTQGGSIHRDVTSGPPLVQRTTVHRLRHCDCHYLAQFIQLNRSIAETYNLFTQLQTDLQPVAEMVAENLEMQE